MDERKLKNKYLKSDKTKNKNIFNILKNILK